jgi:hypothetical protein
VACFRILLVWLGLLISIPLDGAHAKEWTHGVETEAAPGWRFHVGGRVESHSMLGVPAVMELPGFRSGWEGGVRWGSMVQAFVIRESQNQEFWFDGFGPLYRGSAKSWSLGGRVFPFGGLSGLEPFLSGGFRWTRGTLESTEFQSTWEGREGFAGAGLWYSWERLFSAWLDLRFFSGDKGSNDYEARGSPPGWESALILSRSASWSVGAGVGIYF